MTKTQPSRDEQIEAVAEKEEYWWTVQKAFIRGAKWADANPQREAFPVGGIDGYAESPSVASTTDRGEEEIHQKILDTVWNPAVLKARELEIDPQVMIDIMVTAVKEIIPFVMEELNSGREIKGLALQGLASELPIKYADLPEEIRKLIDTHTKPLHSKIEQLEKELEETQEILKREWKKSDELATDRVSLFAKLKQENAELKAKLDKEVGEAYHRGLNDARDLDERSGR